MSASSNPVRILVIDDDAMSRELLSVLLDGEGYAVNVAESGEVALASLGNNSHFPNVILTDMQMPGVTGGQLAGELRRVCGPSVLLLAMSGSQPPAASIAEFDAFLLKPFKVQQIADILFSRTHPATADTFKPQTASNESMQTYAEPSTLATDSTSLLNEAIYQKLACTIPAAQLLEMYTMCLDDARDRIETMRELAAAHDNANFIREAHSIKGSCGMLGATQLHGMAAELEKNGLDQSGTDGQEEVNSLDELSAACDRLQRMLGARV